MTDNRVPKNISKFMPKGRKKRERLKLTWVQGTAQTMIERELEGACEVRYVGERQ